MLVKNWRVMRLFRSNLRSLMKARNRPITNVHLLQPLTSIVVASLVILVPWVAIDPLKPTISTSLSPLLLPMPPS